MSALADLVKAGKVQYIGFLDTPAWKVAQTQVMAHFRGWNPLIALQIEYSLMERTVEGELVPMAEELGFGILPWSPLKGGLLSGKYTRANGGKMQGLRGTRAGEITEKQYDIIEVVGSVAAEYEASSSAVALAWLKARPGVTSTIIGSSTFPQLDANLKALDLTLTPEQVQRLDRRV
jgi:aryl-alcohol dehydrogenase-like predicted oxidoreductase